MNVSSSFLVIYNCNHFFVSQNEFHIEMFYQHLSYLKKVNIAIYTLRPSVRFERL